MKYFCISLRTNPDSVGPDPSPVSVQQESSLSSQQKHDKVNFTFIHIIGN